MFTHLSSLKSYPSTDRMAFGACPPIASKIFGFPIGNLGRTRGEVKRDTDDSLVRLLLAPPMISEKRKKENAYTLRVLENFIF